MSEYELFRIRTMALIARLSMLADAAKELAPDIRPFGDSFESVTALQAHVLARLRRILHGLRREILEANALAVPRGRTTLRHVALGKAAFGLSAIGAEHRVADALAEGARVRCLQFAIACQTLRLALRDSQSAAPDVPELPSIAKHFRERLRVTSRPVEPSLFRVQAQSPRPMTQLRGAAK